MPFTDFAVELRITLPGLLLLAAGLLVGGFALWQTVRRHASKAKIRERQASATEADYRQVVYVLSHEFATPVQTILTCLNNLKLASAPNEMWDRNYFSAVDEARHLGKMVNDVRLLAHLEKATITRQPVPLGAVIQSALLKYADQAQVNQVDVQYEALGVVPYILGNREQLTRVFENLLENALKYRRPGIDSKVMIAVTTQPSRVCIRVVDNGIGIAAEDIPHIFSPGFRSPTALLSDRPGAGLGLAIVQRVVEQHGGEITVDSALGTQTTFTIWLPLNGPTDSRGPIYPMPKGPDNLES
jgi:hypothetical protein